MERSSSKAPFFNGTNYLYWKVRMSAYLQSINSKVWEIFLAPDYVVSAARVDQFQIDQHEANNKARNALFGSLSLPEFDRVSNLAMAHQIWSTLERYHEGTSHVKTRLFETHHREYENFVQLPGESVDSKFSHF